MIANRSSGKWLVLLHVLAVGISSALGGAKEKGGITWMGSEEEEVAGKLSLNRTSFFLGFDSPTPAWLFEALPGSNRTGTRAGADSPTVFNSAGDRVEVSTGDSRFWPDEFNAASFLTIAPFAFRRTVSPLAPTSTVKELDGGGPLANWDIAVNWAPDGVPTSSDDVVFDNVFLTTLPSVYLDGSSVAANSLKIELTTNQNWNLGANANPGGGEITSFTATLTLTTGVIKELNTTNAGVSNIGAVGDGLFGTTTLVTGSSGFIITNNDTDATLQIDAIISGPKKTVTVDGPGLVVFGGVNTYTGATSVSNGGTLLINGNNSAATGAVSVQGAGTVLGGTGTIGGAVTVDHGGKITAGTAGAVGALTLNSSLTFSADSGTIGTYLVNLSGATSDLLAIAGVLDLSGVADQLTLNNLPNGTHNYVLATYGSVIGQFDLTNIPSNYELVYGSHDLSLVLVAVPEAGTWIAAALALATIGFMQRRRLRALIGRGINESGVSTHSEGCASARPIFPR